MKSDTRHRKSKMQNVRPRRTASSQSIAKNKTNGTKSNVAILKSATSDSTST